MPDPVDQVSAILAERQLSTRDKRLRDTLRDAGDRNERADMATDLTPQNLQELARAIDSAKSPQQKAILMAEMDRLRDQMSNLAGPLPQTDQPETMTQRMPYNPAEGVGRPAMTVPLEASQPPVYSDTPRGFEPGMLLQNRINAGPLPPHQPVRMYRQNGVIRG